MCNVIKERERIEFFRLENGDGGKVPSRLREEKIGTGMHAID